MKDEVIKDAFPDGLPEPGDDIEILEVVGIDEDAPPPGDSDDLGIGTDEGGDGGGDAVVLDFDAEASDPAAPPAGDEDAVEPWDDRERLVRLQADFENLRKRIDREREEYYRHATSALVERLLPILDNFERALATVRNQGSDDPFRDGIGLIYRQLMDALRKEGLRPVEALGETFDPSQHEAVATEPAEDTPPDTVIDQLQPGYLFGDRLLRPALVKVAVGPSNDDTGNEDNDG